MGRACHNACTGPPMKLCVLYLALIAPRVLPTDQAQPKRFDLTGKRLFFMVAFEKHLETTKY